MTTRVTDKDLQAIVDRINRMTNSPPSTYVKVNNPDGSVTHVAQIGNYHLSHAYGGVSLHRMVKSGGVTDVLMSGHVPKRELQTAMFAFIRGIESAQP